MDLVTESNKLSISSTLEKMKDIHPGLFCKKMRKKVFDRFSFFEFYFFGNL